MSRIKYVTVCNKITPTMKSCLEEVPRRGGFYNWMFLFRGEIRTYDDMLAHNDFEKYDVIHLNGAPADQVLMHEIRRKLGWNSDTKLVMNNDHVAEVWEGWNIHPWHYLEAQRQADMVFGTEPHQVSNMIDNAYCIPHPHWVHMLKRIGRPEVKESLGYLYHWWESKSYLPGIWNYKLKQMFPKLHTKLYAFMPRSDKNTWTKTMYDEIVGGLDYPDFIDDFIKNRVVVDYCGYHTYGRTSVDMAAIGVPMVGSDRIDSMKRCFPQLCSSPMDGKAIVTNIRKLMTDDKFYYEVLEYAKEAVEYYNYKNSKERFLSALEDSDRKPKEVVVK